MPQPATRGRDPRIPPPVPIRPLVLLDGLLGLLFTFIGVMAIIMPPMGPRALGPAIIVSVVLLLFGLGILTTGGLLFLRKTWTYWISFGVHAMLGLLQLLSTVLALVSILGSGVPGTFIAISVGCNGFMLLLFALCTHHAWKLIRADRTRNETIRQLQLDPEMDVAPGWDEGAPDA